MHSLFLGVGFSRNKGYRKGIENYDANTRNKKIM